MVLLWRRGAANTALARLSVVWLLRLVSARTHARWSPPPRRLPPLAAWHCTVIGKRGSTRSIAIPLACNNQLLPFTSTRVGIARRKKKHFALFELCTHSLDSLSYIAGTRGVCRLSQVKEGKNGFHTLYYCAIYYSPDYVSILSMLTCCFPSLPSSSVVVVGTDYLRLYCGTRATNWQLPPLQTLLVEYYL